MDKQAFHQLGYVSGPQRALYGAVPFLPAPSRRPLPLSEDDERAVEKLRDHTNYSTTYFKNLDHDTKRQLAKAAIRKAFHENGLNAESYNFTHLLCIEGFLKSKILEHDDINHWPGIYGIRKSCIELQEKAEETSHDYCLPATKIILWYCAKYVRAMSRGDGGYVPGFMDANCMIRRLHTAVVEYEKGNTSEFVVALPRRLSLWNRPVSEHEMGNSAPHTPGQEVAICQPTPPASDEQVIPATPLQRCEKKDKKRKKNKERREKKRQRRREAQGDPSTPSKAPSEACDMDQSSPEVQILRVVSKNTMTPVPVAARRTGQSEEVRSVATQVTPSPQKTKKRRPRKHKHKKSN